MSQDAGGWSVRRPRETVGGMANATMPPPPSTMKRSSSIGNGGLTHMRSLSNSRHSLAPSSRPSQLHLGRSSSGTSLADMSSAAKRASYHPGSTTVTKANMFATPGRGSISDDQQGRSSSLVRGRLSILGGSGGASSATHQSFFSQAPPAAGIIKDPRPLKDRTFQARIGQELQEYLTQHNFDLDTKHTLSANFLKSPTQKDFNMVFQWLHHRIDPSHRFQKSIDQELPPLLKLLRYPYEKSITKSQMAAVGGQNWSTFLGLLHWMMQLAQMMERYACNRYDETCLELGIDVRADHIIFDFLDGAYQDFMNEPETEAANEEEERALIAKPHAERMARAFGDANARYEAELEKLEDENQRLGKDMKHLEKVTPDPQLLDNHFKIMEEDRVKFEEYNALAQQRSEKYESRVRVLEQELEKLQTDLKEAEDERKALQKAVDDQGISMQDIDRMTSERERLQKGIESAAARLDEAKKKVIDKELEASRRLEDLERIVNRYNTLAYQIGLIPATAANAKGQDYELRVTVNEGSNAANFSTSLSQLQDSGGREGGEADRLLMDAVTGYQPAHVLNLDLRGSVKTDLSQLRKDISERRKVAMDMMMEDHDLLDRAKEAIEDKRGEVEALEHRVRAAEEEYEKTKETTTAQKMQSDTQIEKLEKELAWMRGQLSESIQLLDQREMTANIEYEQLTLRAGSLREELHTEVRRMLEDIISFKMHMQKNLEGYETFVADELEAELESVDEDGSREAEDA